MLFKQASQPASDVFKPSHIERLTTEYTDNSSRFYNVSRDFSKQYAHIYSARLSTFRNIFEDILRKKWPTFKIMKLCELHEKDNLCIVIGTLFKHQELKPSILKELSDQLEILPQPARTHFVHDSDTVVLEDELQRIKLTGDCIDVHQIVTGVVCAVLGSEDDDGVFKVKEVCWPGCNIQKPLPILQDDRYIVLMSGLNMSSKNADHWLSLHLFLEWVAGMSGTTYYQEQISKVVRVIIAGGIFSSNLSESCLNEADTISSAEIVDSFCGALSAVTPLDLMPGSKDPSGIMLPQKPFHYCLFPKSVEYKSFNRVSNPYECDIGGFQCLGSSGEPIKDILKYSKVEDGLEAMKLTLEWRHMAPTCPDTVPCMPCQHTDPFTIYNCPAVYYCGSSEHFATDLYQGSNNQKVRVVCVPDFCKTKTVAVVNMKNLDCYSMTFG